MKSWVSSWTVGLIVLLVIVGTFFYIGMSTGILSTKLFGNGKQNSQVYKDGITATNNSEALQDNGITVVGGGINTIGNSTNEIRQGSILGLKYQGVSVDELTKYKSFRFSGLLGKKAILVELLVPEKILISFSETDTKISTVSDLESWLKKNQRYTVSSIYLPPNSTIKSESEVTQWCDLEKFESPVQELACAWSRKFGLVRQKIEWKDYVAEILKDNSTLKIGYPGTMAFPLMVQ